MEPALSVFAGIVNCTPAGVTREALFSPWSARLEVRAKTRETPELPEIEEDTTAQLVPATLPVEVLT